MFRFDITVMVRPGVKIFYLSINLLLLSLVMFRVLPPLSTSVMYLPCRPLLCTYVSYLRCLPPSCMSIVYLHCVSLLSTSIVYLCCLPPLCISIVYLHCVSLLFTCTHVVYLCCLPLLCTYVSYLCCVCCVPPFSSSSVVSSVIKPRCNHFGGYSKRAV